MQKKEINKRKNYNLDFIKIKSFCSSVVTSKGIKKPGKISANPMAEKELNIQNL